MVRREAELESAPHRSCPARHALSKRLATGAGGSLVPCLIWPSTGGIPTLSGTCCLSLRAHSLREVQSLADQRHDQSLQDRQELRSRRLPAEAVAARSSRANSACSCPRETTGAHRQCERLPGRTPSSKCCASDGRFPTRCTCPMRANVSTPNPSTCLPDRACTVLAVHRRARARRYYHSRAVSCWK